MSQAIPTSMSSIEVWLIPAAIVFLFIVRMILKIILFPVRIFFWLSVLALPAWFVMNWSWLKPWLFGGV